MKTYTPIEAHDHAAEFLGIISKMAPAVIVGADMRVFMAATARAQVLCEEPATAATCRQIEECLGVMVNLFLDSPLFKERPREQAIVVLDCFEIAGSACHLAGMSH